MYSKTCKLLSICCLLAQANLDRLYIPRKEGGIGFIGVKDSVHGEIESL